MTLPVAGFILLIAVSRTKHRWPAWIISALIAINLINIACIFHYNDDEIVQNPTSQDLFAWVKTGIKTDEHYMIWEPRTMALMTERVGTTLAWIKFNPPDQWLNILHSQGVQYIILNTAGDQTMIQELTRHPSWARLIFQNSGYQVFKITS